LSADPSPFRVREVVAAGRTEPAFLLLHGYGASSFSWREIEPVLARRGRVLSADFVGLPPGGVPDSAYALPALVDHLANAVLERELAELTLVGHSFGGGITLALALRLQRAGRPVSRMVIVSGVAYEQRLPPFVHIANRARFAEAAFDVVSPALLAGQVLRSIVYDPGCLTRECIEGYARPLSEPALQRALLATARVIVPTELDRLTAGYASLHLPALLVWGRHDRVVPLWVGRRLAADLPRAELVVLERCGHLPMEEQPRRLVTCLVDFLQRTSAGSGQSA